MLLISWIPEEINLFQEISHEEFIEGKLIWSNRSLVKKSDRVAADVFVDRGKPRIAEYAVTMLAIQFELRLATSFETTHEQFHK